MDPRQQGQDYGGNNAPRAIGNYSFSNGQSDPFNSFVHTDNESAFDSTWNPPSFNAQQQPINGFDHGTQPWQQNPYQTSSSLPMHNYGGQSSEYDQIYSRNPASFNYSGFDPNTSNAFSPSPFDGGLSYGQMPLSTSTPYDYSDAQAFPQHNETISPQALQNYPFPPTKTEEPRQHAQHGPSMPIRRASVTGVPAPNLQEWTNLASATPPSTIFLEGLHIRPTQKLSTATKSAHLNGFTFVGSGTLPRSTTKATVPRFRRRKSLKELRRQLEQEKGKDPWLKDREPVLKKLKTAEAKLAGPRTPVASTQPHIGPAAESASPSESSESDSEDESEYYSESEEVPEPEEPSPVPVNRPVDPNKAIEYDVIKAVWAKKNVGLSGTVIRTALGEYWTIFKTIRDKWKGKTTSLQQAIDKKDQVSIKTYERRVIESRRLLESCIGLTLKHGHPDIIERLGENPALFVVFYQFLADRFKDSEYTGSFIASILELMTRCTTVDQSMLEVTKVEKVLPRLVKRGDDQGKRFAQKVLDNAAQVSKKQKTAEEKSAQSQETNDKNGDGALNSLTNETKVPRPIDPKKAEKGVTAKTASGSDSRQPSMKVDAKAGTKNQPADASTAKVKVNSGTNKSSGFFSSLQSASKKPGTSSKLKDGKPSTSSEIKSELAAEPPKPTFSFAATMANLNKQAEAVPVKSEETRKPETPEEKQKRLRKEQRRKLRVSFKDDDLVQIREFVHDPEEELGHEDSQVRDVGDSRGEGQMLKMHRDLDLMDEDEDYEPPDEVLPDWVTPKEVDFSGIDADELARNYTSRGGKAEVRSDERTTQEQRELSTLMVIYTAPSDIPSSPREPSEPFTGDTLMEESFGAPIEQTKTREAQYHAGQNHQAFTAQPQTTDMSTLLRILKGQQQAPAPQPSQPPPAVPAPSTGLEAIFAQYANVNNQQKTAQMQIPQPVQQPAPGYNLQTALANITQNQQYGAPQVAPVANLQAILAGLGSQQPAQQAQPVQGYGYSNQYPSDNDRKRQYEQDDGEYNNYGKSKRPRQGMGQGKKPYYGPPRLPCKFFQEGKCRKGDECTFLHE